jgi:poly(ADP-ribose) glycohydrolase ARH3
MDDRERKRDKFRGCMVGLAIGDALGAPVEFLAAEQIKEKHGRVEGYVKSHNGRVELGHWTDDTTMALAVARGIIAAKGKFEDVLPLIAKEHLADWKSNPNSGYGRTTRRALEALDSGKSCYESGDGSGNGNGVAMRIAPFALWLVNSGWYTGDKRIRYILCSSRTISFLMAFGRITHTNPYSLIAGMLQAGMVAEFYGHYSYHHPQTHLNGSIDRYFVMDSLLEQALDFEYLYCANPFDEHELSSKIGLCMNYERQELKNPVLWGNKPKLGFSAITSCPFAWLTAVKHAESFKDGVLAAVNAGGDADTTASMIGAILGALYGLEEIKKTGWCEGLWRYDEIVALADQLFELSVK